MPQWLADIFERSNYFMPHGHCYLWIPSLLWMHVLSDALIGLAYLGISFLLYLLVRTIRLPFSPVFIAFGLFIGLCGLTHFMSVWTVWNPDYLFDGIVKAATAAASVATAIGLLFVRPQIEAVVHTARLSEERRIQLESKNAELEALYMRVKELDELKTQFFANVSHELRTPLALILGPTERLIDQASLTAEQHAYVDTIRRNAQTLLKHVNDLLDIAKLESGKMQVHYAAFDGASWLRRIASQFEYVAQAREVEYEVATPPTLSVEADPDMLERVVINLLSNAFKFTPHHGKVRVALHALDDDLCVSVSDTGPGIPVQERERIFERFRQVDGGSARQYGGTGLGLAIAKDLVELHHGRIELESSTPRGSTFTARFPIKAPPTSAVRHISLTQTAEAAVAIQAVMHQLAPLDTSESSLSNHGGEAATVLIAEDNVEMSDFIARTLGTDYNVVKARDGHEAFEEAQALKPDLIVSDLMMPGMSGDQLVERVRAIADFDAVPILLLTARTEDELRVRLLSSGAQDFLIKPFVAPELLARARNLIAFKRTGDTLRTALATASNDVEALAKDLATKHRQLEIAFDSIRVAKEQAEEANKVKSYFLGLVSHELRTPLSNIFTNLRLLTRLSAQLPESLHPTLERLQRASQQMLTLVEGLLEYTRIESGGLRLELSQVDAHAVAQEVVRAHLDEASEAVTVTVEPPATPLPVIATDVRLLRVVLDNLVSNALKFTREGAVTVRIRTENEHVTLEVHDTGIGIAEADLPRIFLPFEQLEPVHRKSIPGVGLGLAIVQRIVLALGGSVVVTSQPGQGSTFRVRLPPLDHATASEREQAHGM
jgi:signal transduction histidine kinase